VRGEVFLGCLNARSGKNLRHLWRYVIPISSKRRGGCDTQEAMQVAVVRDVIFQKQERSGRVIEPELDMKRLAERGSAGGRIVELIRWLMPLGRTVIGTPRRSVERELEEVWPSNER